MSAIRRKSTREERVELKFSKDENARREQYWGRGRKAWYVCDPGSELRLVVGGREKIMANILNGTNGIRKY